MAYAFDRVMGQLGKGPQEDKADIFNAQSGRADDGGTQSGIGSNTEGDLGPSGSDVSDGKSNANVSPSDVSSSAAYRSNLGKTRGPDLGAMSTSVDAKNAALDNEANSYLTTRASLNHDKLSDSDVDQLHGAVDKNYKAKPTGDGPTPYDVGAQPRDSLGYWSQVASGQVEKVDPFKSTVNVQDSTIDNLGTDAGVQNLLRQGQNAEYNIGDAAFDQALLGQDQGFQQGRQDIMDRYRGVQNKQNTEAAGITNKAQSAADSARSSYLADMKAKLGGFQTQFTGEAQDKEKALEADASTRAAGLTGTAGGQYVKDLNDFAKTPGNSELAPFASLDTSDFGKYVNKTYDPNAQDYRDYLSDDDALRFNNIFSLLGQKDIYGAGKHAGGYADNELGTVDDNAIKADILSKATAGKKTDDERRAAIKAMQDKIAAENPPNNVNPDGGSSRGNAPTPTILDKEREKGKDYLESKGVPAGAAGVLVPDPGNPHFTPAPLQNTPLNPTKAGSKLKKLLGY